MKIEIKIDTDKGCGEINDYIDEEILSLLPTNHQRAKFIGFELSAYVECLLDGLEKDCDDG